MKKTQYARENDFWVDESKMAIDADLFGLLQSSINRPTKFLVGTTPSLSSNNSIRNQFKNAVKGSAAD